MDFDSFERGLLTWLYKNTIEHPEFGKIVAKNFLDHTQNADYRNNELTERLSVAVSNPHVPRLERPLIELKKTSRKDINLAFQLYFLAKIDIQYQAISSGVENDVFIEKPAARDSLFREIGQIQLQTYNDETKHYELMPLGKGSVPNVLSGQLSSKKWLDFRLDRRKVLHPRQQDTKIPKPLTETDALNPLYDAIKENIVFHFLISGEIATGKSSLTELAILSWQNKNPNGIVTIMPMGGDFSAGGGHNTKEAFKTFLDDAEYIVKDRNKSHLLVIEDCHELIVDTHSRYHFKNNIDLSKVSMIVTARPPNVMGLKSKIEDWSNANFTTIQTNTYETANKIIASAIKNQQKQAQFRHLNLQLGGSLIALSAALFIATTGTNTMIQPSLAYRAVYEELERVFDPESDNVQNIDIELLKTGLLAIWMLGAMECDFDNQDISRLLNVKDVSSLMRIYEASNEIFVADNEGRFHCSRHPAWGQLTMRSIDEYDRLNVLAGGLQERILTAAKIEKSDHLEKSLATMLFGMLFQKISNAEDLGFKSAGRHMHDEFTEAGQAFIKHGYDRSGPIPDRLNLLLQIGGSIRRSNPVDINQRQDLLEQAGDIIEQAILLANEEENSSKLENLSGSVLYEVAYLHSLRGDLDEAQRLFSISKENDINKIGREQYGLMSGVRQSIMLTYLGKIDAASNCLDQIEPVLTRLLEGKENTDLMRFKLNFFHAHLEIAFAQRNTDEARRLIDEIMSAAEGTKSVGERAIYDARVNLVDGNFKEAKILTERATQLSIYMGNDENFVAAHRVLGDSLLGLGKIDQAVEKYHILTPGPENLLKFRDFQIQIIDDRLSKIQQGIDPVLILKKAWN